MSKIALIGNLRFNYAYPTNYQKWIDIQDDYFTNHLFPNLISKLTPNDSIILFGNTFENIQNLPTEVIEHYIKFLNNLKDIAFVMLINGNKDVFKIKGKIQSLNYITNQIDGVSVIESITHLGNVTILPLLFTAKDLQNNLPLPNSNILISNKKGSILQHKIFKDYIKKITTFLPVEHKDITFVGNCIQMNEIEENQIVGFHILDTIDLNLEFIENLRSPKYLTHIINEEEDISIIERDELINHINLTISSKLLNCERSYRRRIDLLLNKRNFNRITYIDDIINDEIEENIISDEIIDHHLSYDTIIRDYIERNTPSGIDIDMLRTEYDRIKNIHNTKKV